MDEAVWNAVLFLPESSGSQMFSKEGVLKNCANFAEKHLC